MYENRSDVVSVAEDSARDEAMNDRKKYLPFLARAEAFAADNEMVIGGAGATEYLLEILPGLDSFSMDLFSATPTEHARRLAIALFTVDPDGLGHYTTLMTRNPDEEFAIIINGRELIKVWGMPFHERRNMRLTQMLLPSTCASRFETKEQKLLCMGPEIQLISLYALLCDPSRASQWPAGMKTERALRALMRKEIVSKIARVTGGDDAKTWHTRRTALHADLMKLCEGNRVLLGKNAIALLRKRAADASVVQLVTGNDFRADVDEIRKIAAKHNFQIRYVDDNPLIPSDPRLRRMSITIEGAGAKKKDIIAQLYNTATYDLIPYVTRAKCKIGSPYAILRFRHVDMWIIRLLGNITALAADQVKQLLGAMTDDFDDLDYLAENSDPDDMFPLSYIGDLENAEIAQKRAAHSARKPFVPPFYPVVNANKLAEFKKESRSTGDTPRKQQPTDVTTKQNSLPIPKNAPVASKLTYAQIVAQAQNSSSSKSS